MKQYIKDGIIKSRNNIVLKVTKEINGKEVKLQVTNPSEDAILADGWEIYTAPEPTIVDYKKSKIKEIIKFDSSSEVNSFFIGEQKIWLDKATRVGLKLRFETEIANGRTSTTLWYESTPFNIELNNAVQMLNAIELYASDCYDNTQMHIATVKSMEIIDDIKHYDYKTGYPEKLVFDIWQQDK